MRRVITKTWTFWGYIGTAYPYILLAFALSGWRQDLWPLVVALLGATLYFSARVIINSWFLSERNEVLASYARTHGLAHRPAHVPAANQLGAIDEVPHARNKRIANVVEGGDWTYCDFAYDFYNRTRYGEYKAATVYYGVMYTTLSRELPNVFFDAIRARRRQFRFHFARNQRHSLEGDFDRHFATYFPLGYTIDSMSFISPEVMWALRDAANYDIEIAGDRLYLYGPLYDPEAQLKDMSAKLATIKHHLADNIATYRDQRLPFGAGRRTVAPMAVALQRSTFWHRLTMGITVAYIVLYVVGQIWRTGQ